MLYIGPVEIPDSDEHEGYVAGRYRNSAYSDIWTDVRRCAAGTFTAYVPACDCGWRGHDQPATEHGYRASQQDWITQHFAHLPTSDHQPADGPLSLICDRDFLQPRPHHAAPPRTGWRRWPPP